jgi:1-deoxy-D-xylulose-5-phosphate reductoisomerase
MTDHQVKRLSILGSTGSIGRSTLEVVRTQPGSFHIAGLAAGRNVAELTRQIVEFSPEIASVTDDSGRDELVRRLRDDGYDPRRTEILTGAEGVAAVAAFPTTDLVVAAMVGVSGLAPTYRAIQAGKHVALANKETLVAAGRLMMEAVARHGVRLLPVDSEHNAVFQCLNGEDRAAIRRIWLTASGGPFFRTPPEDFPAITPGGWAPRSPSTRPP